MPECRCTGARCAQEFIDLGFIEMRPAFKIIATCFLLSAAGSGLALAETKTVEVDQSMMMKIKGEPGAVVVGNPMIADITVQGDKVLIHGRTFGTTNVIILDQDGERIAAFDVSVKHTVDNLVAVFVGSGAGPSRFSYNCAPLCESELQVGDDKLYNDVLAEQIKTKIKLATGSEDSKSDAPPAPQ